MWIRNILILVLLYYFAQDQVMHTYQAGARAGFQQGFQQGHQEGKKEAISRLSQT